MQTDRDIRENEAASFGLGIATVIMVVGTSLGRLTRVPFPIIFTVLAVVSHIGGFLAYRWHLRRD